MRDEDRFEQEMASMVWDDDQEWAVRFGDIDEEQIGQICEDLQIDRDTYTRWVKGMEG